MATIQKNVETHEQIEHLTAEVHSFFWSSVVHRRIVAARVWLRLVCVCSMPAALCQAGVS